MKKALAFLTFASPLELDSIQGNFMAVHHRQQAQVPQWGVTSTRQKLVAAYWFSQVTGHAAAMFGMPTMLVMLLTGNFTIAGLLVALVTGGICFAVFLVAYYWPSFTGDFLPKLEAVVHAYRHERQQQLIARLQEIVVRQQRYIRLLATAMTMQREQRQETLKKCKQAQFSNFTLSLIHYVLAKLSGMSPLQCNDQTTHLLMQLYGVDPGSLRSSLEIITGSGGRRKNLSPRKRTEITNRFGEAYRFFEELEFTPGIKILKELEMKIAVQ